MSKYGRRYYILEIYSSQLPNFNTTVEMTRLALNYTYSKTKRFQKGREPILSYLLDKKRIPLRKRT